MAWGRIDDGLYDHPKLDALGRNRLPCVGLWSLAISWSNRRSTDGYVPTERIVALGGSSALADALVVAGMFETADGGYLIHDFLEFNEDAATVKARRDAAAARQRRHRSVTRGVTRDDVGDITRDNDVSHALPARGRAAASRPVPSRPVPSTPIPPHSGGRRIDGTSPRQIAEEQAKTQTGIDEAKRWRRQERQLAAYRGALTEDQRIDMNARDAALDEIPDWSEHKAKLEAEARPTVDVL
jgi:hypothetical protein